MTQSNTPSLTAQATQAVTQPQTPPNDDYLNVLVGEGKKYATPQELAKAYFHAANRITELDEAVTEAKEHEKLFNDILAELRSGKTPTNSAPLPPVTEPPALGTGQITTDSVEEVVQRTLTQREMEREAQKNQGLSMQKLSETYGVDVTNAYRLIADILKAKPGLETVIDNLGNTDPDAFVKFVTSLKPVTAPVTNTPGVSGGPSAHSIAASNGGQLTWSQAREIRKTDPKLYSSKEFRTKLEQAAAAALAKGIDFYQT